MNYSPATHLRDVLPHGWVTRRLKEIAEVIPSNVDKHSVEGEPPVRLCNYVDTYKNERITAKIDFMPATATPTQVERLKLRKGDITITKDSESPWDIAVPALVAEDIDNLVCGYHLAKISPLTDQMFGDYLAWALRSKPVNLQFSLSAQGITRYGLSVPALSDGLVPYPPLEKQMAIAAYLDSETARIDALIAEKRALVSIVSDLEQAAGLELATRGLDRAVDTRPSGIEWLPRVPTHWDVKRNMFLFRQRNEAGVEGLPILMVSLHTGVSEGEDEDEGAARVRKRMEDRSSYQIARRGDVAYNMMRAWQGAIGAVPVDGLVSPAYVVLEPTEDLDPRYFEILARTRGYIKDFERFSYGIASFRWRLYWEGFKEIRTPVPPIQEQRAIVAAFDEKRRQIAALRAHVEREISLLIELRAVTITDAVLGRIDVGDYTNKTAQEAAA